MGPLSPVSVVAILLPLTLAAFWAWMFRDMINNEYLTSDARATWTWEFVFLNVFAATWYYLSEYKNRH